MSQSMHTRLKATVAALALVSAASVSATTVFTPLNGSVIDTTIANDSGTISSVMFDFTNTITSDGSHVVFGGLVDPPLPFFTPGGGSYSLVGAEGDTTFGFNFSGFGSGKSFSFRWDPDSAINGIYGALPKDLVGTKVSAVVAGGPDLRGVMSLDTAGNVGVTLAAVPEPETYALMLAGLGVLGMVSRRRSTAG